ncbi:MAG: hypothetical protein FWH07_04990 [Oscillospiraceae bacterium]|nr:hypothetical protein [Oscillospiraceae bacterium]
MVAIKHEQTGDGIIRFSATGGGSLLMRIDNNQADVVEINAEDSVIYDGLVKTAAAYAIRRGIIFNREGILWKPTNCGQGQ